jgi:glycosyltransferase involved in cell wall biosynthesis
MISLCAIVKNEAHTLGRMLTSVKPVADELIVVDTGSSDQSARVAQEHGARVISYEWQNDFAAARNFSISHPNGRWIIEHFPK